MSITSYKQAQHYLYKHIPHGTSQEFPGSKGLKRTKRLMQLLGNPQESFPVIHIAGTSGKGSTATIISHILAASGWRTGLHVSPHILDIRERVQIDNTLISEDKFTTYLKRVAEMALKVSQEGHGDVTYFELLVALSFYAFAKEGVGVAVMETGMGGLLDGTNVVENPEKICVISKIGFDHTQILGNTLSQIAMQKAGIIHPYNQVLSTWQEKEVEKVIRKACVHNHSAAEFLSKNSIANITTTKKGIAFDFSFQNFTLKNLSVSLLGIFQAENTALALAACLLFFQKKGAVFNQKAIRASLASLRIPARMDRVSILGREIIIDGAHNPQKMEQFISSLTVLLGGEKATFIIAFKKGKDYKKMIPMILPLAHKIIFSKFSTTTYDLSHLSQDTRDLVAACQALGFKNVETSQDAASALRLAIKEEGSVVMTGSLYFASDVYKALSNYSSQQGSL